MQTFKTKAFAHFADRERIGDSTLYEAVLRVRKDLVHANMGGSVSRQPWTKALGARCTEHDRTAIVPQSSDLGTLVAATITKSPPKRQRMLAQPKHILRIVRADISIHLDVTSRRAEEQGR